LWYIDDSGSEHYNSDKDPEYTPQLNNINLVDGPPVYGVAVADDDDALNYVNY